MRIGILGSGLMGGKLGTIFARAGHEVVFSYSHSERKLRRLGGVPDLVEKENCRILPVTQNHRWSPASDPRRMRHGRGYQKRGRGAADR